MKMTFEEAISLIKEERDYQDLNWGDTSMNHSPVEWLAFIQSYVRDGIDQVVQDSDDQAAMVSMRKIAALAVAAIEDKGTLPRKLTG